MARRLTIRTLTTDMYKLIGNTVLIEPMPDADMQTSASGLLLVNHYKKNTLKFRVLAVGPGAQRKRKHPRSQRERLVPTFDRPEVSVGDCILCRAELDDNVTKEALDDGTGRLIVYADKILMVWNQ